MFKKLSIVILIVACASQACYCGKVPQGQQQESLNYDEIPLGSVPTAEAQQQQQQELQGQAAGKNGGKLKEDLKGFLGSAYNAAGKAYEETKPQLNVLHQDLMDSYENIKKNPKVQKATDYAKPKFEYAKNKIVPFYQQGKGKLSGLLSKTGNHLSTINSSTQPNVAPVHPTRPEGAPEVLSAPATQAELEMTDMSHLPASVAPVSHESEEIAQVGGAVEAAPRVLPRKPKPFVPLN